MCATGVGCDVPDVDVPEPDSVGSDVDVPVGVCSTGDVSDVSAVDVPVVGSGEAAWVGFDVAVPLGVCATNTGVDAEGDDGGASTVGTIGDADWLFGGSRLARPLNVRRLRGCGEVGVCDVQFVVRS